MKTLKMQCRESAETCPTRRALEKESPCDVTRWALTTAPLRIPGRARNHGGLGHEEDLPGDDGKSQRGLGTPRGGETRASHSPPRALTAGTDGLGPASPHVP